MDQAEEVGRQRQDRSLERRRTAEVAASDQPQHDERRRLQQAAASAAAIWSRGHHQDSIARRGHRRQVAVARVLDGSDRHQRKSQLDQRPSAAHRSGRAVRTQGPVIRATLAQLLGSFGSLFLEDREFHSKQFWKTTFKRLSKSRFTAAFLSLFYRTLKKINSI